MKEISSQLYGLEAELDSTSETNGTTCFCVDTGTVFVAYGGIWYEQRNVYWKVGGAAESDLSGYSRYMPSAAAVDDLVCFNAMDTGDRYVAYCGHWFKQPIPWSDTALLDAAAAQSGGVNIVFCPVTYDGGNYTATKTAGELIDADIIVWTLSDGLAKRVCTDWSGDEYGYSFLFSIESDGGEGTVAIIYLDAATANDYPTTAHGGD